MLGLYFLPVRVCYRQSVKQSVQQKAGGRNKGIAMEGKMKELPLELKGSPVLSMF